MAPLVLSYGNWLINREPIPSAPMLAAMDSESTDGESSLLSNSGVDTSSPFTLLALSTSCPLSNSCCGDGNTGVCPASVGSSLQVNTCNSSATNLTRSNVTAICTTSSKDSSPYFNSFVSDAPQHAATVEDDLTASFYFESDHLALKGNSDYRLMLRTVALLESQRIKAIQDLDELIQARSTALSDPIAFVHKLQQQVDLGLPTRQNVCEVPTIDWEYYTKAGGSTQFKQPRHITRHAKSQGDTMTSKDQSTSSGFCSRSNTPTSSLSSPNSSRIAAAAAADGPTPTTANTVTANGDNATPPTVIVRGRVVKDSASVKSFNQLWTIDEQKRLEELLVKYPPEEVEMRRWEKIAKALDNRTAVQVQSRVQKYFLKLAKSGLPIPGRVPYVPAHMRRRHRTHHHHRHQKFLFPSSTFLASHEPPVYMADDDDDRYSYTGSSADYSDGNMPSQDDISDDEEIPPELRTTEEYQELLRLKQLRRQKQQDFPSCEQHIGYRCDRCECEPIIGVRWHCTDCPADSSVDFCDNCKNFVFETGQHKSSHTLEPVKQSGSMGRSHLDSDYTRFMPGDYNYLDPNYMPAS